MDGGLRQAGAAVADNRAMSQQRAWLARSRVQSLQDSSELAVGRHPPAARHTSMEARSIVEMPIVQEGRYAPPVHIIKLTEEREITPYKWVHPDEDR
jgi:hypothetical protein